MCIRDSRRGQHAVQDRRAEARRLRELRVHVMRIEIADESGTHDDVRFGDGDGTVEAIADANVFEPRTAALQRVHPATAAPRSRRLASSARQSSVNAMPA